MKRIIEKIIIAFIVVSLVGCTSNKVETIKRQENSLSGEYSNRTIILHTNDIHGGFIMDPDAEVVEDGGLEAYAAIASAKKQFEEKGGNVILTDAGDFSQGSIYVALNKGAYAVDLMSKVGYDLVGLGNHDFDYGIDNLKNNFKDKNINILCSNIFKDGESLFDSEIIYEVGKLKIGFFSIITPSTQTITNPSNVAGLEFAEGQELFDVAQKEIDLLRKEADIVICLSHLGVNKSLDEGTSIDLYNNINNIDFIIDGHSHTVMQSGPNKEPIQSCGTKGQYIGVIEIDNNTKKIVDNYLLPLKDFEADLDVLDIATNYMKGIDEKNNSIFAYSDVELNGEKKFNRSEETNLGDLVTDAMLWEISKNNSFDVASEDIVAITNGGGIRASINVGGVSMKDVNNVLPFGNTLAVTYCKGSLLLEALEASTYITPELSGSFPQVAGIEFTIDTTVEYDAGEQYPNSTYFKPNSIRRVSVQSINGNDFDENKTYAVVTNSFCVAGGDTYYAFKKANDMNAGFDTGMCLDEVVNDYIVNELDGKISDAYAMPQNRITIIK